MPNARQWWLSQVLRVQGETQAGGLSDEHGSQLVPGFADPNTALALILALYNSFNESILSSWVEDLKLNF